MRTAQCWASRYAIEALGLCSIPILILFGVRTRKKTERDERKPQTCLHLCVCSFGYLGVCVAIDSQPSVGICGRVSAEPRSHFDDKLVFECWLATMRCDGRVAPLQRRQQCDLHPNISRHLAMCECCEHWRLHIGHCIRLGGSVSGNHGNGLGHRDAFSLWQQRMRRKDVPERPDGVAHIDLVHDRQHLTAVNLGVMVKHQKHHDSHSRRRRRDDRWKPRADR
jgi:hypothetical protein